MRTKSKDPKNPYVNSMSLDQVADAEAKFWYVQVGMEVPEANGVYTFSKKTAENIYYSMFESLRAMRVEGTTAEKTDANFCLQHFRMIPLRIH